ncbi:bifunctional Class II Aminoacyl-tRNA synthetase-Biotinyl protein ligase (BPL) and lipoyl protein ligase (LPL)/Aminoacyl-tRNA synthetase [Babesia duncani]|uniref:threonine--tRNA ligase n=1 Tax=Babesia duncani TaxID=323732 RepID=A0AAD9PL78_9APIC|nr:bifunctional Class II Aminoacyl-tRNA synthetase-Biotinyl protein ligase (BPL) and lipoyl protein ligase (LPL)/Aminoacyl-tRNA synthetase [Babesia duncani]
MLPNVLSTRRFIGHLGSRCFTRNIAAFTKNLCHKIPSGDSPKGYQFRQEAITTDSKSMVPQGSVNSSECTPQLIVGDPKCFSLCKNPPFIKDRLALFEKLYEQQQQRVKELQDAEAVEIQVKLELPDSGASTIVRAQAHWTTPRDIAEGISKDFASKVIVAEVFAEDKTLEHFVDIDEAGGEGTHGESDGWALWDLSRPLEGACRLRFLDFDSENGKRVFWHSSAHMLGSALETLFGGYVTIGPPTKEGFFYDVYLGENTLVPEDMQEIAKHMRQLAKKKHLFQRLVCTREQAMELMKYNPFKLELIRKKVLPGHKTVCYRCGDFVDLCCGPHIYSTGVVHPDGMEVTKFSACYWLAKSDLDVLQRVYAISFPTKEQLQEHQRIVREAKLRDHRVVGTDLGLFYFDATHSPGSCFWFPRGARIYNRLQEFMRENYRLRGYNEIVTPNIFACDLWKRSGHYDNYRENMYMFTVDDHEWGMKAMNCPGHCLMFKQMNLSYRQLPLRLADFGVLHRNELAGSLTGLTRVRRFQQDDAHIFCTPEQVFPEVRDMLHFVKEVYQLFGFDYFFKLSTKPEKALGTAEVWARAEDALRTALETTGNEWVLNPGDGAFYGPKIDIVLYDSLKRQHQCGTIQLDFNLPERFNLEYRDSTDSTLEGSPHINDSSKPQLEASETTQDPVGSTCNTTGIRRGFARPIIIHRALFGSLERFIAIVLEHFAGKLPFWLSPTQLAILPLADRHADYCHKLCRRMMLRGIWAEVDASNNTINKKVKSAQGQRYCYMAVVGDREVETETVTLRPLDSQTQDVMTIQQLEEKLCKEAVSYKNHMTIFKL